MHIQFHGCKINKYKSVAGKFFSSPLAGHFFSRLTCTRDLAAHSQGGEKATAALKCSRGISVTSMTVIKECVGHAFLCFARVKSLGGFLEEFQEDSQELCWVLSCLNVDFIDYRPFQRSCCHWACLLMPDTYSTWRMQVRRPIIQA